MKQVVHFTVNGTPTEVFVEPWRTLADVLREDVGLPGLKIGCDRGNCGSCTILLDGKAVRSCLILTPVAEGKQITTIEGLAKNGKLHPLQEAFMEHFAVQCGFCTPGMILAAKALLDENPDADEQDIRKALKGNLCRCTGYKKIIEAILAAKEKMKSEKW